MNKLVVNDKEYKVITLLGKGKGGYSYLVTLDDNLFVLKQIHHEPCDYYQFGNKIEAELNDYKRILETGINIPKLIDVDIKNERIIKEYIDGPVISELVEEDKIEPWHIEEVIKMQSLCKSKGINIDYYPTNFIVSNDTLYYIDYECNNYDPKWDFDNWGKQYWVKEKK